MLNIFRNSNTTSTAAPTVGDLLNRDFMLYSLGTFSEMEEYAQSNNLTMESVAVDIVRIAVQVDQFSSLEGIGIEVTAVREGSIIIEYSLQSADVEVLELAQRNVDIILGLDLLIGGSFVLQIDSNTMMTDDPTWWPTAEPTIMNGTVDYGEQSGSSNNSDAMTSGFVIYVPLCALNVNEYVISFHGQRD